MKRVLLTLCTVFAFVLPSTAVLADDPDPNPKLFGAFWFVVGSCWEGFFEGSETDRVITCFRPMYRGKAIRENYVVIVDGERTIGETVFSWDGATETINYQAVDSSGSSRRGTAIADDLSDENKRLVFPAADHITQDGTITRFQSSLEDIDGETVRQVVEEVTGDGVVPVTTIVFERKLLSYGPRP